MATRPLCNFLALSSITTQENIEERIRHALENVLGMKLTASCILASTAHRVVIVVKNLATIFVGRQHNKQLQLGKGEDITQFHTCLYPEGCKILSYYALNQLESNRR